MRTSITDVTYTNVRAPSGKICDRLVIEGTRVKVIRREDTFKDLMIGVRQPLATTSQSRSWPVRAPRL